MLDIIRLRVHDRPGVLDRIAGLIRRHGINIDTITSGSSTDGTAQITIVFGENAYIQRLCDKLGEMSDILHWEKCEPQTHMLRELLLASFSKGQEHLIRKDMRIVSQEYDLTFTEYAGDPQSVAAIAAALDVNGVTYCRGGTLALPLTEGEI